MFVSLCVCVGWVLVNRCVQACGGQMVTLDIIPQSKQPTLVFVVVDWLDGFLSCFVLFVF